MSETEVKSEAAGNTSGEPDRYCEDGIESDDIVDTTSELDDAVDARNDQGGALGNGNVLEWLKQVENEPGQVQETGNDHEKVITVDNGGDSGAGEPSGQDRTLTAGATKHRNRRSSSSARYAAAKYSKLVCNLQPIVSALLEASVDKQEGVQASIYESLHKLGTCHPETVLESCHVFLTKHTKVSVAHRVVALNTVETICKEQLLDIEDHELVTNLISLAVEQMTSDQNVVPEYQRPASGILVAIGQKFCHEIMDALLTKFQPGVIPHFFTVQTMASLAAVNTYGIVPFLKAVLGTMLPMLSMLKQDNLKWVFSQALARFSEAILEYIANIDSAPDASVKKEVFSWEVNSAFDILFNNWLHSKEAKVRQGVLEALGHMSHLMTKDKLTEQMMRLIPGFLGMYRRHSEPFHVTQGLAMVLDAVNELERELLEPLLDNLLSALFAQVCSSPDYSQPFTVKNHYEVLRCFDLLAQHHSSRLVSFLIQRLDNSNDRVRIGSLTVLKHLINSSEGQVAERIPDIMKHVQEMLYESQNKVQKVLAQTIVSLAHHGYLEQPGGREFVEFIVKLCALPNDMSARRPSDGDHVSNEALHLMCDNILHLLTTTVHQMEKVLWPNLLEYVLVEAYTSAIPALVRSLAYLATKKREEQSSDYEIEYQYLHGVPNPQALFARLLVMIGVPLVSSRGLHTLKLLKNFAVNIEKNLMALWDEKIPPLLQITEECEKGEPLDESKWEEQSLDFLTVSLTEIDQEEWTLVLSQAMANQLPLYDNFSKEKGCLMKFLACVLCRVSSKEAVSQHVETIFSSVKHSVELERQACAKAIGICSSVHLDAVLVKLEKVVKTELSRKTGGLLSFMKDSRGDAELEKVKATVLLCYGQAALNAPAALLVTRVNTPIVTCVMPYLQLAKDPVVYEAALITVTQLAQALQHCRLEEEHFLQSRKDLLNNTLTYLQADGPDGIHRLGLSLKAATELIKLPPQLMSEERCFVLKVCFNVVYPLATALSSKGEQEQKLKEIEGDISHILEEMNELVRELLLQLVTTATLDDIFSIIEPWLKSMHCSEREAAMNSLHMVLHTYWKEMRFGIGTPSSFGQAGHMLARLAPRVTDPYKPIRSVAVDCLYLVLKIASRYEGHSEDHKDELIDSLPILKSNNLLEDADGLYEVSAEVGKVLSGKLPHYQLMSFLDVLYEGLLDLEVLCSNGACVVLSSVLKVRGGELHQYVPDVVDGLYQKMIHISCPQTRKGTIRLIRILTAHHIKAVVSVLLNHPLPYDECTVDCWKDLARDPEIAFHIVEQFLELIQHTPAYEEQRDPCNRSSLVRIAVLAPLAAVCALREMFLVAEMEELAQNEFPRIFTTLLEAQGCYVGTFPPVYNPKSSDKSEKFNFIPNRGAYRLIPIRIASDAFKAFLLCAKCDSIAETLIKYQHLETSEDISQFAYLSFSLAQCVSTEVPQYLPKLVTCLNHALSSVYESQRIAAAAFFAELIHEKCGGDFTLLETIINSLITRLVDSSPIVRRLCIRGLGYVGGFQDQQQADLVWVGIHKYSTTVLNAMMTGMDNREDPGGTITLEAMNGLSSVLSVVEEAEVRCVLINVALRIRPYFEKDNANLRAAAFTLFGNLAVFGDGPSKPTFQEQIHNNLVSLLLHLNDETKDVTKACKFTLRQVGPLLGAEQMNNMFQRHLLEEANLQYATFMYDLSKILVAELSEKIPSYILGATTYFKSSWPVIRGNAAILVGMLYGHLPEDRQKDIHLDPICGGLMLLLKDPTWEARARAAEAMSFLFAS